MPTEIQMAYSESKRTAVLTFPNGRPLKLSNVTKEQAEAFRDKHGAEFQKRDCCLHTADGTFTRDESHDG